ncbi:MAG: ABC transporter substrate-binding protein [Promethearchaeati archaeon SRVP18_Atabeyarchaeia-1]
MSTGQKRIIAIAVVVVIAVAGVGGAILLTQRGISYVTPGVTGVPDSQIIKVGVLDDMTDSTGKGSWQGSWLAAYEINTAGGVVVNGTHYYFGLISEDTSEAAAFLDTSKGVAAAQKIISVDGAQFLTGGFRTESLKAYIETVMDHKLIFIGTGAATDYFCQNVLDSHSRYQYFFRDQPINSTSLGSSAITELAVLRNVIAAMAFGGNTSMVKHWAVLREALDWTVPMDNALKAYMGAIGWDPTPVQDIAFPMTADSTAFSGYWTAINGSKAQVVIPIISAQGGVLMDTQYNATRPQCLICGINVPSQLQSFWTDTAGKCMYEVVLQTFVRHNKTVYTIPFWDHYLGNFSAVPIYTSAGGYDAITLLRYAINQTQSFTNYKLVAALETINKANPITGVAGKAAFTRSHDLSYGWPYGVPIFAQWQSGGNKPCITSGGALYPNYIVTGSLMLPPQGINKL